MKLIITSFIITHSPCGRGWIQPRPVYFAFNLDRLSYWRYIMTETLHYHFNELKMPSILYILRRLLLGKSMIVIAFCSQIWHLWRVCSPSVTRDWCPVFANRDGCHMLGRNLPEHLITPFVAFMITSIHCIESIVCITEFVGLVALFADWWLC